VAGLIKGDKQSINQIVENSAAKTTGDQSKLNKNI